MNFDSIEGLSNNEIEELFESLQDKDYLSTHFVCACKATLGDYGTHLQHDPTFNGWCHEKVDTSLVFSENACREKCFSSFGDYTVAHHFYRLDINTCNHWNHDCSIGRWSCHHLGASCTMFHTYYTHYYTSYWAYDCGYCRAWEMNATWGRCYVLKQR